jgi:hypothetical protein
VRQQGNQLASGAGSCWALLRQCETAKAPPGRRSRAAGDEARSLCLVCDEWGSSFCDGLSPSPQLLPQLLSAWRVCPSAWRVCGGASAGRDVRFGKVRVSALVKRFRCAALQQDCPARRYAFGVAGLRAACFSAARYARFQASAKQPCQVAHGALSCS